MKRIIMASASPRREELLSKLGLVFEVIPSNIDENIEGNLQPEEVVQKLSYKKALYVAQQLKDDSLVIGADTIVFGNMILGKPQDELEAFKILKSLQGKWHEVITGITVINSDDFKFITVYEKTLVKMKNLSDTNINNYIKSGESLDKAGAYGIQGLGSILIDRIEGCYFNVVGLPLAKLSKVLEEFNIFIL